MIPDRIARLVGVERGQDLGLYRLVVCSAVGRVANGRGSAAVAADKAQRQGSTQPGDAGYQACD